MSDNIAIDSTTPIHLDREKINVKGRMVNFDALEINNIKIIVKGTFIRTAMVREEWDEEVADPGLVVNALKKSGIRIDLFTFVQRLPESRPKYNYFMEWDSVAAIPIFSHQYWLKNQIPDQTRNKIKKASKIGVEIRPMSFGEELVNGISNIYNETPVRQGRKNTQYNMPYEMVKKLNATFIDRCDFIAAFYKSELIGYLKIVYTDRYARVMGILGKMGHQDKSPMNLLISSAVAICAERNVPYFVYAKYDYGKVGSDSLREFKKNNGFENILVPRYFIPLNIYGKIAVKLSLHKGIKNLIPIWMLRSLLKIRNSWNSKKKIFS
jgi:hypothetical protein